ncbi:glycosyltransferase family 2 protein, partial [Salinisphaera sp. USBA-960]|nr:glycosyltransferase family 2 protein [Salifodinibacter halophilus]
LALRRALFAEIGGMDETLAVAFNDVDLCLRLHARGYRNVWTPHAELYHHESASRGPEDTSEKRSRFFDEVAIMRRRWGDFLLNDPAYNPNLSLESL